MVMGDAAPQAATGDAGDDMSRARKALPGWHIWTVPVHQPPGTRWCGRPPGHEGAVAQGDSAGELIEHAREWADREQEARKTAKPTPAALGIDPQAQQWERSGDGDGSLEVAFPEAPGWSRGDWVLMRTAGDPDERILVFDRNEWECFLDGARNGEFDDATA